MRGSKTILFVTGLLFFALTAVFAELSGDIGKGMHGMRWGSAVSDHKFLTKVRQDGPVGYYVNSEAMFQAANQPVHGVVYGFYHDQFFAVYIKLRSPEQFSQTLRHFSARYGDPGLSRDAAGEQSVYRWKNSDVKIKLKMNESSGEIKLGIYYIPLSSESNEERLERIPDSDFTAPAPEGSRNKETSPLLDD